MKLWFGLCAALSLWLTVAPAQAFTPPVKQALVELTGIYQQRLGSLYSCEQLAPHEFRLCTSALRNDYSGPFVLHHGRRTDKVVVLFHGLSDSPFYMRSIAEAAFELGYNVVVGLLPGHALVSPDQAMEAPALANHWQDHVAEVIAAARSLGYNTIVGGFSTGGALTLNYTLLHPDKPVSGLMLFSGALQLASWIEWLSAIPGSGWLSRLLDGVYGGKSPNPYKYALVSRYGVLELARIIRQNRRLLRLNGLALPLFAAHSRADESTPIAGIEELVKRNEGQSQLYIMDEAIGVCHGNLTLNQRQVDQIDFDANTLEDMAPCYVPKANPLHQEMLEAMVAFLQQVRGQG